MTTKSFKALVRRHVKTDQEFTEALLREALDALLSGDVETARSIFRDYLAVRSSA